MFWDTKPEGGRGAVLSAPPCPGGAPRAAAGAAELPGTAAAVVFALCFYFEICARAGLPQRGSPRESSLEAGVWQPRGEAGSWDPPAPSPPASLPGAASLPPARPPAAGVAAPPGPEEGDRAPSPRRAGGVFLFWSRRSRSQAARGFLAQVVRGRERWFGGKPRGRQTPESEQFENVF